MDWTTIILIGGIFGSGLYLGKTWLCEPCNCNCSNEEQKQV